MVMVTGVQLVATAAPAAAGAAAHAGAEAGLAVAAAGWAAEIPGQPPASNDSNNRAVATRRHQAQKTRVASLGAVATSCRV